MIDGLHIENTMWDVYVYVYNKLCTMNDEKYFRGINPDKKL